jgi:1,4-dihydroxy-2-naphthoate octaprenyltransferase
MIKLKLWFRAIRAPFFTATIIPIILGTVVAWNETGLFNLGLFLLTLLGILLMHTGTNLANDYYDHVSGNDENNNTPTPFSGGSRIIQDGLITAESIISVSLALYLLAGVIGYYLYLLMGDVIIFLALAGGFLGFFYSAAPLRHGYRGLGEISVFLGFGPLLVAGAYYVQVQKLSLSMWLISVPAGILIMLVLFVNGFQDREADKKTNKKTLVVLLGKKKSSVLYILFLALVYLWVISGVMFNLFPPFALLTLITLPIALKTVSHLRKNYDKIYELVPANAGTIKLHVDRADIEYRICSRCFVLSSMLNLPNNTHLKNR